MQIYVVGGAIRDTLLHRPVSDVDYVVVGSSPKEMLALGYKQVGADFPVFLSPNGDEYALARTERKTGIGYHGFETDYDPSVTLEDDLMRRDVTINSMAVPLDDWDTFQQTGDTSLVVDPYNGCTDLTNKMLRHTSNHFADDPVRLLRIARFHAKYNFNITKQTIALMEQMVSDGEVDHLVPERVWQEIDKAMQTGQIVPFFWILNRCGALEILIPNLKACLTTTGFAVRKASLRLASDYITYMLLFGKLPDPANTLHDLRAPKHITRMVVLFHKALEFVSSDITHDSVLAFTKMCTNPSDTLWVLRMISDALSFVGDRECAAFDVVLTAEQKIRFIGFSSLTTEQQSSLQGADIAKAIDVLRLDAISQW